MKFAQVILDDVGRRCDRYLESNKTMRFEHDFRGDLLRLMHEAEHGEPFAFVRFADGERAILENKVDTPTADGWKIGNEWMRSALADALSAINLPRYLIGLPCPCCDQDGADWYRRGPRYMDQCTYSNLFVNGNYDVALPWLRKLAHNWCVVSSAWGSDIRVPAQWSTIKHEHESERYISATVDRMIDVERPILIAAGPLAKVLAYRYWQDFQRYTILDIGSALDPDLFGGPTRGYHDPSHANRKKICVWNS